MDELSGDFEIHLTVLHGADDLAAFAGRHGVKFSHILLDRGVGQSQPMLTVRGRGSMAEMRALAQDWEGRLRKVPLYPVRVKIESAPWNPGVPQTDEAAREEPSGRYFEHHVKLLLADASATRLVDLTHLVAPHSARLSRNARRHRDDGQQERFVTQRCHGGRATAMQRLDALTGDLRGWGYEIVEVEQEYVVYDSRIQLDAGWLEQRRPDHGVRAALDRQAPAGVPGYPSTYQPLPAEPGVWQRGTFDPALKQFRYAYRAGEPQFDDAAIGQAWRAARRAAMTHLLGLVAASPWARSLVLRGSVPLRAWLGQAARDPGDLDFVVTPHTVTATDRQARRMLDGIIVAVRDDPGPGLHANAVTAEDIWTYERASGRRLVFPFAVDDLPPGTVQMDVVFQEKLPVPPVMVRIPPSGVEVPTATPELSLAWKLLWLATDMWPQGKDLYDATLLAEYTTVSLDLVREVLRPELGRQADSFTAASVLAWPVDWDNFRDEYPTVRGEAADWQERLAVALERSFNG